jgi:hypothetical protein
MESPPCPLVCAQFFVLDRLGDNVMNRVLFAVFLLLPIWAGTAGCDSQKAVTPSAPIKVQPANPNSGPGAPPPQVAQ